MGNASEAVKKLAFTALGPEGRADLRSFRMRSFRLWVIVHGDKQT